MAAIAERAGVGKPALDRRFADKAELVAAAIAKSLPAMTASAGPSPGDARIACAACSSNRFRSIRPGMPPSSGA